MDTPEKGRWCGRRSREERNWEQGLREPTGPAKPSWWRSVATRRTYWKRWRR